MASPIVKAGVSASLTGPLATQGRQALAGLQAWAAAVNQAGGLWVADRGQLLPLEVVFHDDASQPAGARAATQRLIAEDKVDLLFGPYSSGLTQAAAGVAERHKRLLWNQGGAADSIHESGFCWVVGVLTPASQYLAGLPTLIRQANPNAATVAVLRAVPGAFPRLVAGGFREAARQLGFRVSLEVEYPAETTDFTPLLAQVKAARPDALAAVGRIENDLALARQLADAPFPLGVAAVVASPIQQFADAIGPLAKGFVGPSQWEPAAACPPGFGPAAEQVMAALRRQTEAATDYPMVQSYAAGLIAQRCVEAAGTLDQAPLREAASHLDFVTFYGRFKIDPATGRQIGRSTLITQRQLERVVVVWPPEQAQAPLRYPWR